MPYIKKDFIDRLDERQKRDGDLLLQTVREHAEGIRREGVSYKFTCPVCGSHSLTVTPGKMMFKCFSCNEVSGKTAKDFLMSPAVKKDLPAAVEYIAAAYGTAVEYEEPAGKKKPGRKPNFTRESTEGINRMISRRPVVNGSESSEVPYPTPIQDTVRLNKFIANSGVCSRREADTLIQAGVVTVNGEVVTELGTKVNVFTDDIRFNGERLKGEEKVYIVMNKPKGFVTTASDPHAEKTVIDLIKNCPARVYPVGRLDKNTTGVLMLTNDGEIAERLTHPSYDKKKIYQVALDKPLSQEDFDRILSGVVLTDGEVKADELEYIDANDKRKLGIEIHSGKNRIVRRIFETLGYNVKALDRVYFAGLTKKGLKKGEWRYLTEGETNILKMGAYV